MARVVQQRRYHPTIRQLAQSIIASAPEKDAAAEAAALHSWVRDEIRYTPDIIGVETLIDPLILLQDRQGDCDDKSMLYAALAQSVGFPVQFCAVAFESREFEHVLPYVNINGVNVPAETTENVPLGWQPENITRFMVENI